MVLAHQLALLNSKRVVRRPVGAALQRARAAAFVAAISKR
jgi:hypothetical protein